MGDLGGLKKGSLLGELKVRPIDTEDIFFASHSSSIPLSPSLCPCCGCPVNSRDYGAVVWNNAKKY